ncbi:MAG: FliH/SctL family protein [Proteobacteria bacterium]|nr:FliH/SctL family protein [Pseudomonadota bacterium]
MMPKTDNINPYILPELQNQNSEKMEEENLDDKEILEESVVEEVVTRQNDIVKKEDDESFAEMIDINKITSEAFEEGRNSAIQEIDKQRIEREERLINLFESMRSKIDHLSAEYNKLVDELLSDAVDLSIAIGYKVTEVCFENESFAFVKGFIEKKLTHIKNQRNIVIWVHENDAVLTKEYLESHIIEDQWIIRNDMPSIKPGDCHIEFDKGVLKFDRELLMQQLEHAVFSHIKKYNSKL